MSDKAIKVVNNIFKNKDNIVTKWNPLVEFPYKLSLMESKILLFVISMIQPDDTEFNLHRFKVKDLVDFLGLKTKNYDEIRSTIKSLQSKIITINKDDGGVLDVNWMSSCEYFKWGDIEIELSIKLSPYLLQLKQQFISYKLLNIINLSSVYSIRFYEFLKKYERIGQKTYSIDELKKIFQIDKEYNLYGHFKKRVLDASQKDLKENTDIYFTYKEIKEWKKVMQIHIKIHKNNKEDFKHIISGDKEILLSKIKEELNIHINVINDIFETYSIKKIQSAFSDSINKFRAWKINNPEGYFLKLVKDEEYLRKEIEHAQKKKEILDLNMKEIEKMTEIDEKAKIEKSRVDEWISKNQEEYNLLLNEIKEKTIKEYSNNNYTPSENTLNYLVLNKTRVYIKQNIINI